ncbi:MAG: hypothetical protein ACRDTG_02695 [Pseudonocardiaceae bacterium]
MAKHAEPQHDNDNTDLPVPNRRERRGNKSGVPPLRNGKSTAGRTHGVVPNQKQYSTRRRGG